MGERTVVTQTLQPLEGRNLDSFSISSAPMGNDSRGRWRPPHTSPLQQIHWLSYIDNPKILPQRRITRRHRLIHRISHVPIRSMPRRRRPQFRDVHGFGKIHLEQRPLAEGQRNRVLSILPSLITTARGELLHRRLRALHSRLVLRPHPRRIHFRWRIKAVDGRKVLHDLYTAAMPVHVAKAADIHQDVETELLPGRKGTQHLIMLAAMPQPKFDDFPPPLRTS